MKTIYCLLILFVCVQWANADSILLKNGTLTKGQILMASDSLVTIDVNAVVQKIPKADILSLVFTSADVVFLKLGKKIECKVISKSGNEVTIVTEAGVQTIDNETISEVKWNIGHELKISDLPPTGAQFSNQSTSFIYAGDFKENVFVKLNFGGHIASLDDWKHQFVGTNGNSPSTTGVLFGGEIGFEPSHVVAIGLGYEYCWMPTVNVNQTSPTFDDHVSYTYAYGSLKVGGSPETLPQFYIYGGLDAGFLTGKESIENLNGISFDGSATVFAPRIKVGGEYFTSKNIAIYTEIGYLIGNVKELTSLGQTVPNYSLDFSGVSFIFGVSCHIPLIAE